MTLGSGGSLDRLQGLPEAYNAQAPGGLSYPGV